MRSAELILLDTHVLLWSDQDDPAFGSASRKRTVEALDAGRLVVSAFSFWEVALLVAKGRIRFALPVARWRRDLLGTGLIEVPLEGATAVHAAGLPTFHADPADRIIVATAVLTGALLLTADERILNWPGALRRHDARL